MAVAHLSSNTHFCTLATTSTALHIHKMPLHCYAGLGVRLVVVAGAQNQIDALLTDRGMTPSYAGGYRVTDKDALKVAMEAAGQVRTTCEQILSKVRKMLLAGGTGRWE